MAKVKILPEKILPDCLAGARPPSHSKFCCCPTDQDSVVQTAVDRHGNVLTSVAMVNNRQVGCHRHCYGPASQVTAPCSNHFVCPYTNCFPDKFQTLHVCLPALKVDPFCFWWCWVKVKVMTAIRMTHQVNFGI